eukprot:TRINITY_DN29168_c0_g1_i1.p1 TRINITY_DN29168_c0_g1~~TRINITY_DN29168_c0_g1_i1.p1  ORF type:complete len:600 (-),score=114.14 TRINITY_DN29168_c0_g1_i1:489-2288(-)
MASSERLVSAENPSTEVQDDTSDNSPEHNAYCPVDICFCLPVMARSLVPIPTTYRVLQDVTHGLLLAGMIGGLLLVLEVVGALWEELECQPSKLPCVEEVLTFLSVLPCSFVLNKLVLMYDAQLAEKEAEARKHRLILEENYGNMISSMEGLLSKATQSSAKMAEDSFEERRRDFQSWLRQADSTFSKVKDTDGKLLQEFQRFVLQWCQVFRECSIDPINHPKMLVEREDLAKCTTIGQVVAIVLERLKSTHVRFISSHRDQDARMLDACQEEKQKIEKRFSVVLPGSNAIPVQTQEIELAERGVSGGGGGGGVGTVGGGRAVSTGGGNPVIDEKQPLRFVRTSVTAPNPMSVQGSQAADNAARSWMPCRWFMCGLFGVGSTRGYDEGGFPWELKMVCARCVILSPAHSTLTLGLVFSVALVSLEAANGFTSSYVRLVSGLFYMLAICNLLIRFEQIDLVQRLVHELIELEKENTRIKERGDRMNAFWTNAQQLLDLWVHRTMPRLNLLFEVSELLQDEPAQIALANQTLTDLENRLPEIALWRQDGGLTDASKKAFSGRLEQICKLEALPVLITTLNKEMDGDLLRLEATPAEVPVKS